MARGKIFITGYKERKDVIGDYWYSYSEDGVLRVYKQNNLVFEQGAKIHDAFEVIIKGGNKQNAFITEMTPPRKKWEVVAWLLGFSKFERSALYQEYLEILEKRKEESDKPDYVEFCMSGPNFEFVEYTLIGGEDGNYRNLACWVAEGITKEEVCHLIPEYNYPEFYVRKVLAEVFEVSDEEFNEVFYED